MVTTWIVYCLLMSGLLGLAALAGERALGHYRKPVRWVWVGAIVGSVAVPALAFLAPALFRGVSPMTSVGGLIGLMPSLPALAGPVSQVAAVPVEAEAAGGVDLAAVSALLGWAWGLSILFLGFHLARTYRRLQIEMKGWTPGQILDAPVLLSSDRGPAVVGVRRAVIVMPEWIAELEEALLRLVFLHEREHQKAGDHRLFVIGIAALVLMPWNAILWWQVARLRLAIEFDCDRRVLARGVEPRDYAEALLVVGGRVSGPLVAAAAFAERKPAVERRLRRMTEPLAKLRAPRTLGAAGVAALAIVLVLGAPPPAGLDLKPEAVSVTALAPPQGGSLPVPNLPPPAIGGRASDRPAFVPYDTPPVLNNLDDVVKALSEAYPAQLEAAGIGGRVELWLYVNEEGRVEKHLTKTSSGNSRLDAAAQEVAPIMRFKPAFNRNEPTPVWVSQHLTFMPLEGAPPVDEVKAPPLIVIDGVIQGASVTMSDVGSLDIDHVEVIKGAAALRSYGDRGRNGVIVITTKAKADSEGSATSPEPGAEPAASSGEPFDLGFGDFDDDGRLDVVVGPRILNAWTNPGAFAGENAPLVVIDGVIQSRAALVGEGLPDLPSPDVVDHVRLLQGLAAERRYGSRAGRGVIEITTKRSRDR